VSSHPSAAFAPERIAEMLRVPVAEVLARRESDRPHPERCWRATRRALRIEGGGLVHVTDDEARRLGWHVLEIPTGGWGARALRDSEDTEQHVAVEQAAEVEVPAPTTARKRQRQRTIHNLAVREGIARRKADRVAAGLPATAPRTGSRTRRPKTVSAGAK
jgi:hypothetical protein